MAGISTISIKASPCRRGQLFEILDIAHAPFGIAVAQAGVEHRIAERGVLAVALERPVEKQPPVRTQIAPRARDQALRRRATARCGSHWRRTPPATCRGRCRTVTHLRAPCGIGQVDPQRRADIGQAGMRAPRLDAPQMLLVEIARPPGDVRRVAREMDHMLAGAAAGLDRRRRICRREIAATPPRSADGCDETPPHRGGHRARPAGRPCRIRRQTQPWRYSARCCACEITRFTSTERPRLSGLPADGVSAFDCL